jgi:hypothetical protein
MSTPAGLWRLLCKKRASLHHTKPSTWKKPVYHMRQMTSSHNAVRVSLSAHVTWTRSLWRIKHREVWSTDTDLKPLHSHTTFITNVVCTDRKEGRDWLIGFKILLYCYSTTEAVFMQLAALRLVMHVARLVLLSTEIVKRITVLTFSYDNFVTYKIKHAPTIIWNHKTSTIREMLKANLRKILQNKIIAMLFINLNAGR